MQLWQWAAFNYHYMYENLKLVNWINNNQIVSLFNQIITSLTNYMTEVAIFSLEGIHVYEYTYLEKLKVKHSYLYWLRSTKKLLLTKAPPWENFRPAGFAGNISNRRSKQFDDMPPHPQWEHFRSAGFLYKTAGVHENMKIGGAATPLTKSWIRSAGIGGNKKPLINQISYLSNIKHYDKFANLRSQFSIFVIIFQTIISWFLRFSILGP